MNSELTYYDDRHCENCDKPIPDQEHKLRNHCRTYVDDNGNVVSCKDDKNADRRRITEEQYRKYVALHKQQFQAIEKLLNTFEHTVTIDQLNHAGVQLDKNVTYTEENGLLTFFFLHHRLDQQPNGTFTIKHEEYVL
ncbi:hypothetical protein [Flavisolibacter nicotianae]|uniref:hypothetical protein n=1 Tax=Flavisolibacter nicotianae TaxID=2364882 RepID=UPI000EB469DA|nr:hypothetical protein [Flavisolibacter nicotianae]